ncbi:Uu.00g132740.m01.CDS01 [Anthostomella pinea]|uniref:Uu.00g132740.m01.CDS01 n=1 Tax=Anthostomella pinea TaxID=933095 RepID=A0AAI8VTI6_9PEZI|nr:Uu.00g132740.m01.CDS01 [Anthostomella pinea]
MARPVRKRRQEAGKHGLGGLEAKESPASLMYAIRLGRKQFQDEIEWIQKFKGAPHIIQLATLDSEVMNPTSYNNAKAENPIMIMELLDMGDVRDLACRINEAVATNPELPDGQKKLEYIPNRILWHIFLCLARGCIALAYPPGPPGLRDGKSYREEIDPEKNPKRNVHHDLDLTNGNFVNLYNVPEIPPRLKSLDFVTDVLATADFLCLQWDTIVPDYMMGGVARDKRADYYKIGKPGFQPPEQARWRNHAITGLGVKSNIWGIGMTMWCLITLCWPQQTMNPNFKECWLPNTHNHGKWIATLGHDLLATKYRPQVAEDRYKEYDFNLRLLIARCMAEKPTYRPDLQELLGIIEQGISDGASGYRNYPVTATDVTPKHDITATGNRDPIKGPPLEEDDGLLEQFVRDHASVPPAPMGQVYEKEFGQLSGFVYPPLRSPIPDPAVLPPSSPTVLPPPPPTGPPPPPPPRAPTGRPSKRPVTPIYGDFYRRNVTAAINPAPPRPAPCRGRGRGIVRRVRVVPAAPQPGFYGSYHIPGTGKPRDRRL